MKGWTYEDAVPADLTNRNSASSYVLFFYVSDFSLFDGFHHICGSALCQIFFFHVVHVGGGMFKKLMIPFAKVVQSRFSGGSPHETVLRAFPVAGEKVFAFPALRRKSLLFHPSESLLLFPVHHFYQRLFVNVA